MDLQRYLAQDGDLCNQGSALGASLVEAVPGERGGHKVSVYSDSRAQPLAVELVEVSQRTTLYPTTWTWARHLSAVGRSESWTLASGQSIHVSGVTSVLGSPRSSRIWAFSSRPRSRARIDLNFWVTGTWGIGEFSQVDRLKPGKSDAGFPSLKSGYMNTSFPALYVDYR
jgi:hypothetical protein